MRKVEVSNGELMSPSQVDNDSLKSIGLVVGGVARTM